MGIRSIAALAAICAASSGFAQFMVLGAESPSGSNPPSSWMGVQRWNVASTGGAAVQGTGIAASLLNDPEGLATNAQGELFVGNRHGNGAPSSISRFVLSGGNFVANGTITGNALFGTHGINFSPTGELYATNVNGPVSRFLVAGPVATPNGTLGSGPSRDVFVNSTGLFAYVTQGTSGILLKYDAITGALLNSFATPANALHNGNWRGSDLFVADFATGNILQMQFDVSGNMSSASIVANTPGAISVAFSPDGNEMFVGRHQFSTGISRFLLSGSTWNPNGSINTGVSMGDIHVVPVPEPASCAAIGLGLVALMRRRKHQS